MKLCTLALVAGLAGCSILDGGTRERALIEESVRTNSTMLKDIKDQLIRIEMTMAYKVGPAPAGR